MNLGIELAPPATLPIGRPVRTGKIVMPDFEFATRSFLGKIYAPFLAPVLPGTCARLPNDGAAFDGRGVKCLAENWARSEQAGAP